MSNLNVCVCGCAVAETKHHFYPLCIDCIRKVCDLNGQGKYLTKEEAILWNRLFWGFETECETIMKRLINVFFFLGDQYESLVPSAEHDAMWESMRKELDDPMLDFLDSDNMEDRRLAQHCETALPKYCDRGGEGIDPDDCLYGDMD